jgi:hypothetical protein
LRYLFFCGLVLCSIISCNSVDNVGFDGLSAADQAYYRFKEEQACLADTKKDFDDYEDDSNDAMADFERKQLWTYKTTFSDNTVTTTMKVWKVSSGTVYFLQSIPSGTDKNYKFIKISPSMNSAFIQNIRTELCKKPANLEFTINNPPKVEKTELLPLSSDRRRKVVSTFNHKSKLPGYFGYLDQSLTVQIVDKEGDEIDGQNPKPYKTVASSDTDADYEYATYSQYPDAEYCVVDIPSPYTIPYTAETCTTDATDGNGPAGFPNPGDELTL